MQLIHAISPVMVACCLATQAQAADIPVPNGGFETLYKPGSTTITADVGGAWTQGVGLIATVEGGTATYSDTTTGTTVDIPGWVNAPATGTPPNGGWAPPYGWPKGSGVVARQLATPYGTHYYSSNGSNWGNPNGGAIQSASPLTTVTSGETYTISMSEGPGLTLYVLDLLADGVILTPDSSSSSPDGTWTLRTKKYGAASLASSVGKSLTIRVGWGVGAVGARAQLDNVRFSSAVADTTPPTLTSFEDNKSGGPIVINEPVTYTVNFSEPMNASTVDATDFANTGVTAMTVNSVTPTANPAVFLVGVTPTEAGTLQLQVMAGATLTDLEDNPLATGSAILDNTSLVVNDTPPASTTTVLVSSGSPSTYGNTVTFTATVSPPPSGGTVQFWYGGSYLGSPVTVNTSTGVATVSTTTLGVATHEITADYSGNFQYAASTTAAPISQVVGQAPLTVRASNALRPPNTPNPDPFPYQITGFKNGQNLASSGVTGTPVLTTDAVLSSPAGNYVITCALGSLAAANYNFTLVNGTLTVKEVANTFSVNFYVGPDWPYGGLTTDEQKANVRLEANIPAGSGDWLTSSWSNFLVPWGPAAPLAPVTLTSNKGSSATFTFKDCRNGYTHNGPRTTLLGDGNGNMMDAHVNSTLDGVSNKFDMEVTNIPFTVYDVIFYIGANLPQFGDGTGVIKFNGGADRAFTLKPGAFDGTFTEMVDATTQGNYIVFRGVTGSSFTTQTWGTGPTGFNHIGPNGFQIRQATLASGFATWAATNAPGQTPAQDHDDDGVDNGIEYFMGKTGSSFTAMPGLDATHTVTWTMDPAYVGTYEVQTSPNLGTWTNVDPRPVPAGGNLSYLLPPGSGKQFVRLLVTPTL